MRLVQELAMYLQHPVALGIFYYGIPISFLIVLVHYFFSRSVLSKVSGAEREQAQQYLKTVFTDRMQKMLVWQLVFWLVSILLPAFIMGARVNPGIAIRSILAKYRVMMVVQAPLEILVMMLAGVSIVFLFVVFRIGKGGNLINPVPSWEKWKRIHAERPASVGGSVSVKTGVNASGESALIKDIEKALARESGRNVSN